ncbi:hemin-degrading factor [Viridibacterium curvum]|uniref:Hemin-degrading factor n=1 Tax=Viridibacterium curvum TaxID=1101404 RepID=A0ABP9QMM6_9RHOO
MSTQSPTTRSTAAQATPLSLPELRRAFTQQRREAKARHRDIAASLGVSEGELIAAHAGGIDDAEATLQAVRLRAEWPDLIESLEALGEVMALTRNHACVHEKTGVYRKASHNAHVGLVLGGEIDLRLFYGAWAHGFAVSESTADGVQRSLQFFDAQGTAIHKIFARAGTDLGAWQMLVDGFASLEAHSGITVVPTAAREAEKPDSAIDVEGFRAAWAALHDTHEFFGVLRKYGLSRTQALRLAEPRFASAVAPDAVHRLLEQAAASGVPIMVFTGNPGVIQIHSGTVKKIAVMGPWLNVLDPGFNLHLRADLVASAWAVRKPTDDGIVTALELFDAQGENIAMLFGERKPGKPELPEWRALVEGLLPEASSCAA